MNISNAQARDAFYKAADVIDRNPDSYDFGRVLVGDDGCPACMWGHVGRVLGFDAKFGIRGVADLFEMTTERLYTCFVDWNQDGFDDPATKGYHTDAAKAAQRLRNFADKHFPEVRAFESSGMTFDALMKSFGVAEDILLAA